MCSEKEEFMASVSFNLSNQMFFSVIFSQNRHSGVLDLRMLLSTYTAAIRIIVSFSIGSPINKVQLCEYGQYRTLSKMVEAI